jgi:hypothetical protein
MSGNMKISAFNNEEEKIPEMNSGLKLKNKNQSQKRTSTLEEDINVLLKNKQETHMKIAELSSVFMSFVRDKTIPENKSSSDDIHEKEVVNSLIKLCLALNSDQTEPEGIGSIGLGSLLIHALLEQRNIINGLRYKIHKLESENKTKPNNDK